MSKTSKRRKVSVPCTALLGSACDEVKPLIAVWPTEDGIGGRAPTRADTVHVIAFSRDDMTLDQCEAAGMEGGCALIGKTTIRDMVRYALEAGIVRNTGKIDTRYARRFALLRDALLAAAQEIKDVLPDMGSSVTAQHNENTNATTV